MTWDIQAPPVGPRSPSCQVGFPGKLGFCHQTMLIYAPGKHRKSSCPYSSLSATLPNKWTQRGDHTCACYKRRTDASSNLVQDFRTLGKAGVGKKFLRPNDEAPPLSLLWLCPNVLVAMFSRSVVPSRSSENWHGASSTDLMLTKCYSRVLSQV